MTECLTNYICRLADAHCVSVGTLLQHEVGPLLGKQHINKRAGASIFLAISGHSLDSMAPTTPEWIQALQHLTHRSDLFHLTMLPWNGIIADIGLLRKTRAWCPECLNDWSESGLTPYSPLLWQMRWVSLCHLHNRSQLENCPHCQHAQPVLRSHSRIGRCLQCQGWLGDSATDRSPLPMDLHGPAWVAER